MEFKDGSLPYLPETSRDLDKQSNNLFLTGAIIGVYYQALGEYRGETFG